MHWVCTLPEGWSDSTENNNNNELISIIIFIQYFKVRALQKNVQALEKNYKMTISAQSSNARHLAKLNLCSIKNKFQFLHSVGSPAAPPSTGITWRGYSHLFAIKYIVSKRWDPVPKMAWDEGNSKDRRRGETLTVDNLLHVAGSFKKIRSSGNTSLLRRSST